MKRLCGLLFILCLSVLTPVLQAQTEAAPQWWLEEPYRLIQTNLREIDAIGFDVDVYVNSLKDIGANAVLINVGGIVANYYTDLEFHHRNPNLKFDIIEGVIDRLHLEGVRVIGRFDFSKLNEQMAEQKPEWLYKSVDGEQVNYNGQVHTCVNGGYQQEYALKILSEALERFPLDGVFFNMIGYQTRDYSHHYHGICQSDACRERFSEWSGGLNLPVAEDMNDPVFRQYQQFKNETKSEQFHRIHDLIKSYGNHIAINTYTHAGTDFYRREANSHGALYDDYVPWEYQAAHNVKSTLGSWKDKQVSNAAVHFYGYPARHSADARWLTQQRLVQNILYGAGVDFYCIGRLDNLEDRAVLQNVKNVFRFHERNEAYLHHTVSANRVLLLSGPGMEYRGIFEWLTEQHILFDVMESWCMNSEDVPRPIERYELVILPDIAQLSDAQCKRLDRYVNAGGKLLATGFTSTQDEIGNPLDKIRLESLGVKSSFRPFQKEQGTYFRIFDADKARLKNPVLRSLDLVYAWEEGLLCEAKLGAKSFLGFIPPAMIGPPEKCYYTEVTEIPGLIFHEYGKGSTAFFPFRIGALYHHKRHHGHAELLNCAIAELLDYEQDLRTNASPLVEIARQQSRAGDIECYGFLNHTGQLGNGFFAPIPVRDLHLAFRTDKAVRAVKSLQSGAPVPYVREGDLLRLTLPELKGFDVVLVEYLDGE